MLEKNQILIFDHQLLGRKEFMKISSILPHIKNHLGEEDVDDMWVTCRSLNDQVGHKTSLKQIEYLITTGEITVLDSEYTQIVELLFR